MLAGYQGTRGVLCGVNRFVGVGGLWVFGLLGSLGLFWSVGAHECRSFDI